MTRLDSAGQADEHCTVASGDKSRAKEVFNDTTSAEKAA